MLSGFWDFMRLLCRAAHCFEKSNGFFWTIYFVKSFIYKNSRKIKKNCEYMNWQYESLWQPIGPFFWVWCLRFIFKYPTKKNIRFIFLRALASISHHSTNFLHKLRIRGLHPCIACALTKGEEQEKATSYMIISITTQ